MQNSSYPALKERIHDVVPDCLLIPSLTH